MNARGIITVANSPEGDFKIYRIFTDRDGLEKHCLNSECYDYLIPYTSADKEKKKRKLNKLNLPYK